MAKAEVADQEALSEESLRIIGDVLYKGTTTLKNGKVLTFEAEAVLRTAQWAATTLRAKKPKFLETPENFNLKRTDGT